jgi:hypothetical protein
MWTHPARGHLGAARIPEPFNVSGTLEPSIIYSQDTRASDETCE